MLCEKFDLKLERCFYFFSISLSSLFPKWQSSLFKQNTLCLVSYCFYKDVKSLQTANRWSKKLILAFRTGGLKYSKNGKLVVKAITMFHTVIWATHESIFPLIYIFKRPKLSLMKRRSQGGDSGQNLLRSSCVVYYITFWNKYMT